VDSNYYKTDFEEAKIYTYLVRPGIELGYETEKSLVVFDYTLDAYFYDEKDTPPPGRRSVKDFIGHALRLKSRTKPNDRLTVVLDNSFYKTRNPEQSDALSNKEVREKYWINRLSPVVFYDFAPKFTAGARYRRTDIEYTSDRSGQPDSTEHRGIFDLIYSFRPTASLGLNYQHWKMDYDHNNDRFENERFESDYKSDQIGLILKKSYRVFSFEAGAGYQKRRFDESDRDDIDTPVFHGVVKGEKGKSHFALRADQNFNNYYDGFDYYVARRVTLEVGHIFVEKLPVVIRGGYQNSDYEEFRGFSSSGNLKKRNDDTYGIQGSIGYIVTDWLTAEGKAGYDNRDSNLLGFDYNNKYGMVELKFAYDVGKRKRQ